MRTITSRFKLGPCRAPGLRSLRATGRWHGGHRRPARSTRVRRTPTHPARIHGHALPPPAPAAPDETHRRGSPHGGAACRGSVVAFDRPHRQVQPETAAAGVHRRRRGDRAVRHRTARSSCRIAKMPKRLQDAVLAVEDTRIPRTLAASASKGLARAAVGQSDRRHAAGCVHHHAAGGAHLLPDARRTAERKIKEALLALQIEDALSKDHILELYLNQIYLGQRAYGFAAAAQTYFGKPLDQLSPGRDRDAGRPAAEPDLRQPGGQPRARAGSASAWCWSACAPWRHHQRRSRRGAAPRSWCIRSPASVERACPARGRDGAPGGGANASATEAYTEGIRVITSLRAADQRAAHAAVRRGVLAHERQQPWRGPEDHEDLPDAATPTPERAAAAGAEGPPRRRRPARGHRAGGRRRGGARAAGQRRERDASRAKACAGRSRAGAQGAGGAGAAARRRRARGAATARRWADRAMAAGRGRARGAGPGHRPRARAGRRLRLQPPAVQPRHQGWRQPGSSFKPFLYSAALENGVMPDDAGRRRCPSPAGNGWSPANSDGRFDGPITAARRLARSKNLVSMRVLQQVGLDRARATGSAASAWTSTRQPDNLTLALGTGSVTPLQMARAYAVLRQRRLTGEPGGDRDASPTRRARCCSKRRRPRR